MICQHLFILAADDTNWTRLLPAIVIGVVWLLAISSSIFKSKPRSAGVSVVPLPPPRAPGPSKSAAAPRLRPPPAKVRRPVAAPGALAKMRTNELFAQRQAAAIQQMLGGAAVPLPQKRRAPAPPKRRQPPAIPSASTGNDPAIKTTPKPITLVDGPSLTRRMQPALLRYQFILTEVLRPPLALRDDEGY